MATFSTASSTPCPAPQRQQTVHPAHKEGGQYGEQHNRQQTAQHRRHGQQCVLGFFAQMLPHPFFKGSLLLGGVVVVPMLTCAEYIM